MSVGLATRSTTSPLLAPSSVASAVLIKERKFGAGCIDAWQRDQGALIDAAERLLKPTLQTLAKRAFLFGDAPTLADAALYGLCAMIEEGNPRLLPRVSEQLVAFSRRVESRMRSARR